MLETTRRRGRVARLASALFLTLAALVLPGTQIASSPVSAAGALSTACGTNGTPSVVAVHGPQFYVDVSVGLMSRYAGYTVRAGTGSYDSLWMQADDFTGGAVSLASGQPSSQSLGSLDSGQSTSAYFLLTASALSTARQSHSVTLYDANPALGGTAICTRSYTYNYVADTIKALANKVRTITSNAPATAQIGDQISVVVTGNTGTLGAGPANDPGVLDLAPNALASFPAGSWQLVDARINISPDGVLTPVDYVNRLYLSNASGPDRPYTARYTFRAIAPSGAPASVKPIQYIASGTQVKHTDLGSIPVASLPSVSSDSTVVIAKAADIAELPPGGGAVGYTVTLTNSGQRAQTLDQIVDTPPAGSSYVTNSVSIAGAPAAEPQSASGDLVFVGPFTVPAYGTLVVTYDLMLDAVSGPRANSVVAQMGSAQIDSTISVLDDAPATATVVVRSAGGPDAQNDSASTNANAAVSIAVLANDTTTGTDPIFISAVGTPSSGTAVIVGDQVVYTPGATFSGLATFTYTVSDGTTTDTATVTVTVAPQAVNDTYTAAKGETKLHSTVLANDVCGPTPTCTVAVVTPPSAGTLTLNTDGSFTYAPAGSNTTGVFSFTYRATDPSTGLTTTAVATIYMNDAAPDYATTPYQTSVGVDTAINDTCVQCRPSASTSPTNGVATYPGTGAVVTYQPNNGFWGLDTWIYKMPSNDQASITILTAPPASTFTVTSGQVVNGTLPSGRACAGCTYSVASGVSSGTLSLSVVNGSFTYTPNADFSGTDSFTYRVLDPVSSLAVTQTITLNVGPDAVDDAGEVLLGETFTADLAANDECAPTCTYTLVTTPATATFVLDPATGEVTMSDITTVGPVTFTYKVESSVTPGVTDTATVVVDVRAAIDDNDTTPIDTPVRVDVQANDLCVGCTVTAVGTPTAGSVVINGDGTVTYTPLAGFSGVATFTYTVTLNGGSTSATVTVEVLPDAVDDTASTLTDTPVTVRPTVNDLCAGCSITAVGVPTSGAASVNLGGTITYTPAASFTGAASFDYTITDAAGNSASATVFVTITAPPTLVDDTAEVLAGNAVTIDVLANDECVDCQLDIASDPANGTVSLSATGEIVYLPRIGFSGQDNFTYLATDASTGASGVATVVVIVSPRATDDRAVTGVDVPVTIDVALNDSCTTCTVAIDAGPEMGSVDVSGTEVRYTPKPGFTGTDTFTYVTTDPVTGRTARATVTIEVNDAVDDVDSTRFETPLESIDVVANDICERCTVVSVDRPAQGTASVNPDGTVAFEPARGFFGIAEFTYTVSDGAELTATATVRVLVGPPDRTVQTTPDTPVTRNVLTDGDCPDCTASQLTSPSHGDVEMSDDGTFTYTPAEGFIGTDSFEYWVIDTETGFAEIATYTIVVDAQPGVSIDVVANGFDNTVVEPGGRTDAGDDARFLVDVTNSGDKVLSTVTVNGPVGAVVDCGAGTATIADLAVGATVTCTADLPLVQADLDAGTVSLEATAIGQVAGFTEVSATDSDSESILRNSSVQLDKSVASYTLDTTGPVDRADVGDSADYDITVTNTGNVTITDVLVTDPLVGLSPLDCGAEVNGSISLAPGASATCTASFEFEQDDIDRGSVTNLAWVDATTPDASTIRGSDSATALMPADGSISVSVDTDIATVTQPDTVVTFTLVATNDGNVTLTDVLVADALPGLSALDCRATDNGAADNGAADNGVFDNGTGTLSPGESVTCTATYTVTQADIDAGSVSDAATASGNTPDSTEVDDAAAATVTATQIESIGLVVGADVTTATAVDESITFTYEATNTGNVTLTEVGIVERLAGVSTLDCEPDVNGSTTLAPDETMTCTATYTVTQADLDAGQIVDDAIAQGTAPSETVVDDVASDTIGTLQVPDLLVEKSSDVSSVTEAGDTITFSIEVTNSGNVTLSAVTVVDPMPGLSALDCGAFDNGTDSLAPGDAVTCTATYTASQDDIDGGSIANTASVSADSPDGTTPGDSDSHSVSVDDGAAISIVKSADVASVDSEGDEITYTIVVTNTGNSTLSAVTVDDPMAGLSTLDCGAFVNGTGSLAPDASATCTATYTVTQADVDAGSVGNDAAVSARKPGGGSVVDSASETVTATAAPLVDIFKSADVVRIDTADAVVTYTIEVSNSGNVTLSAVTVVDPMPGLSELDCGGFDNGTDSLAPGDSATCIATYTVTQADLDAGDVHNHASVTAQPPVGPTVDREDSLRLLVDEDASLTLSKTADVVSIDTVDQVVTYTLVARNTGNVTLHSVLVEDTLPGLSALDCGAFVNGTGSLAPDASATCTATYSVTQDDLDAGSLVNVASADAVSPSDTPAGDGDGVTLPVAGGPAMSITKVADATSYDAVGDVLVFTIEVANTGNVTLTDVSVADPMPGLSELDCGAFSNDGSSSLAPGDTVTCTAFAVVGQSDLDAGEVTNQATARATAPGGDPVVETASESVDATQTASLDLAKSATPDLVSAVDEVITFTLVATNTGNVTLDGVVVSDTLAGLSELDCGEFTNDGTASLAPEQAATCTATYTVTQDDLDAGSIANSATVSADDPSGEDVDGSDRIVVPVDGRPALDVSKTSDVSTVDAVGDVVTYTISVTNVGNVTVDEVSISDPMPGLSPLDCGEFTNDGTAALAPGDSATCTAEYTVTQVDLDAGTIGNSATVTGSAPDGAPVDEVVTESVAVDAQPSVLMSKTADVSSVTDAGDEITYTITVTNTGNVTLSAVSVTDPMPGLSALDCGEFTNDGTASLAPDETVTCTATYTADQDDIDAGSIANSAAISAETPDGSPFTDTAGDDVSVDQGPAVTVTKTADVAMVDAVGDVITYTITVSNTGNVTLSGVSVADPMPGLSALDCGEFVNGSSPLAPDATATCVATYTVDQDDLDGGTITNAAVVSADDPSGEPVGDTSNVSVDVDENAAVSLTKSADVTQASRVGERVTYSLVVTNTGNVTVSDVLVVDPMVGLSALDCGDFDGSLAPDETVTCTATYSVTQDDLNSGAIDNTASVTAVGTDGSPVDRTDTHVVDVALDAAIRIVKTADVESFDSVGDVVGYSFAVTNTGNLTLYDVTIEDRLAGLSDINCATGTPGEVGDLSPDQTVVCIALLTITQQHLDGAALVNTATVTGVVPVPGGRLVEPLVVTDTDAATVLPVQTPSVDLVRDADVEVLTEVGQAIRFTYTATNTGNVTLQGVSIVDPLPGLSTMTCDPADGVLAPGATMSCWADYTVTQDDLDAGEISSRFAVEGMPPGGEMVTDTDDGTLVAARVPAVSLELAARPRSIGSVGETVTFTYAVTNVGNASLTNMRLDDTLDGVGTPTCPATSLAPNATVTCTATYTATQADIDSGTLANRATARADAGSTTVSDDSAVRLAADGVAGVTLEKSATPARVSMVGEMVTFTFVITNSGGVTLDDVEIDDPMPGLSEVSCPGFEGRLQPAQSVTCEATYAVTAADLVAGAIVNTATVSTRSTVGDVEATSQSTASVAATRPVRIELAKTASDTSVEVGDTITYTLVVTNRGDRPLADVRVDDPMPGLSAVDCGDFDGQLAPDESATCIATYTARAGDVASGIVNTASVTSSAAGGVTVADTDSVRVTVAASGALPATGSDIVDVLALALLTLLAGLALLVVHRRRLTP